MNKSSKKISTLLLLMLGASLPVRALAADAISSACIDIVSGAIDDYTCSSDPDNGYSTPATSLNTGTNLPTDVGNTSSTTTVSGSTLNLNTSSGSTNVGNTSGSTTVSGTTTTVSGSTLNLNTSSGSTNLGNSSGAIAVTGSSTAINSSTDGTSLSSTGNTTISSAISSGSSNPAVTISGQNGSLIPNTSVGTYPLAPAGTGVLITGSGNNGGPDVYIASQDGKAAITVTNTGVQIISPSGTGSGQMINVNSTNNYGVAGEYNTGTVTNNFGNGNSTSTGAITNLIGSSAAGGGTVTNSLGGGSGTSNNSFGVTTQSGASSTNNIGTTVAGSTSTNTLGGGDGTTTNSIGNATGTGSANNNFGNAASGATATNTIGGGLGVTTNAIGNGNYQSTVSVQAGNSASNMANGVNTNSVTGSMASGVGGSTLPGGGYTSTNSGSVLSGATGTYATVDGNGKISMVTGVASQSSTNMTITNGLGNTNGLVVNERQATISGGTRSSSMTLNDYGATFSNSANGRPIQVHGVADGTSRYDAINVQQLNAVKQGIAGVAAMNNIPSLESGKQFNLGLGVGGFDGETSFAVGANARVTDNFVIKASASHGFGGNDSNVSTTSWGVGGALSW